MQAAQCLGSRGDFRASGLHGGTTGTSAPYPAFPEHLAASVLREYQFQTGLDPAYFFCLSPPYTPQTSQGHVFKFLEPMPGTLPLMPQLSCIKSSSDSSLVTTYSRFPQEHVSSHSYVTKFFLSHLPLSRICI